MALRLEQLEARQLLHSGPGGAVMDAEHLAVFGSRDPATMVITGGLVPDAAVTDQSVASGDWSNPQTWNHGVPKAGDNVLITAGTMVTVDGNEAVDAGNNRLALRTIRVDGTLDFNPHQNTTLLVDTIIVEPSGIYQMGTQQNPIDPQHQAKVVFADLAKQLEDNLSKALPGSQTAAAAQSALDDYEAARTAWDPLQFGLGLVAHGEVRIFGSRPDHNTPGAAASAVTSWVQGSLDMNKGATTLSLGTDSQGQPINVPASWKVGDSIIITGMTTTRPYYLGGGIDQDEEVRLTGINGNTFTVNTPLQNSHTGGATYVADVVRNAVFQSENPGVVARRGHIMFMHNPDDQVEAAGFYGLGRTDKRRPIDDPVLVPDPDHPGQQTTDVIVPYINLPNGTPGHPENVHRVMTPKVDANGNTVLDANGQIVYQVARTGLNPRGRYAVHFHRTGDETPVTISDSAVIDSPGWGIVNHSSNVDVENNVAFNIVGAAFVTEAGDEAGTFNHNIAIKSLGSGEQVDSRKSIQDFGHDGDGFWLQGGNVSLTNNVASGQRHAGFVFFPRGLVQKGFTPPQTMISGDDLPASYGAEAGGNYDVADIPLKQFSGNVAFADAVGYESWFSLQHTTLNVRTVIQNFTVFDTTDHAIFTPYTSRLTFDHVTVRDPVNWAGQSAGFVNTGLDRNDLTADVNYDHVNVSGFAVGINAPVVGVNNIVGGSFNNLQNILVTTTNSDTRVLNIRDASPTDPIQFVDNLKTMVNGQMVPVKQWDIYLQSNWQPLFNDITRNFSKDIIKIGLVTHNGQQVYYKEQAYDFVPYPSATWLAQNPASTKHGPLAASWVPVELLDLTNAQLYSLYGLAIGGVVAPMNSVADPLINGIVGPAAKYIPDAALWSPKWYNDQNGQKPYYLIYSYFDPTLNQGKGGYIYIDEQHLRNSQGVFLPPVSTPLHGGWNVITRYYDYADGSKLHQPVSLLVYNTNIPPYFVMSASTPTVLNQADVANGSVLDVVGYVVAPYGQMQFTATVKLNDPKYVSPIWSDAAGNHITITFSIQDFAGNVTVVKINFLVTANAPLIKDIGQKNLPYIDLSITLQRLMGLIP